MDMVVAVERQGCKSATGPFYTIPRSLFGARLCHVVREVSTIHFYCQVSPIVFRNASVVLASWLQRFGSSARVLGLAILPVGMLAR